MPSLPTTEAETSLERKLAAELLSIGAVAFNPEKPYTWASGLLSPVYCDNRLTISHPRIRRLITDGFAGVVASTGYRPEVVAGTATAGIPHAAWLADRLELPLVYVRSAAKGHGRGRRVEGALDSGRRVVLVEDLVSTGMSSLDAVSALTDEGAVVIAVLAIFTYGLPAAQKAFSGAGVPLHALTSFEVLLDTARKEGRIDSAEAEKVADWHRDPQAWSEARAQ
ncbi:MAG TPA: orotate phosphoribosyltransferase [Rhodothermales bacterium]